MSKTAQRYVFVLGLLLVPATVSAQNIRVTSVFGPVEVISASGPMLTHTATGVTTAGLPVLNAGDTVRTGPSGQMTLQLPDASYVVIHENTTFEVGEYQGSGVRELMRVIVGKVRFHIQKFGGRPNPYQVNTPTALIAVRGTDFDVRVDETGQTTEVWTYEGRVRVETVRDADREVVLDAGFKTLVRAGQKPLRPVGLESEFGPSRSLQVVRVDDPNGQDGTSVGMRSIPDRAILGIDNDRLNRTIDPLANPNLGRSAPRILRGKGSARGGLIYP